MDNKPKKIKLSGILKEKSISLGLKENEKKKVIAELVGVIAASGALKDKKVFLKAIMEREKLGSTGIGSGVAIPHAKSKAVRGLVLAFAKKEEGIDFGALDGEKTYLFFALASPEEEVGNHLKALAEISRLVKDKFTVGLLMKAKTKKEVLKIISDAEKNQPGYHAHNEST